MQPIIDDEIKIGRKIMGKLIDCFQLDLIDKKGFDAIS
jgi:hypothetical protein